MYEFVGVHTDALFLGSSLEFCFDWCRDVLLQCIRCELPELQVRGGFVIEFPMGLFR